MITLPEQFKQLPEATKARIAELQKQANDLLAQATTLTAISPDAASKRSTRYGIGT